MSDKLTDLPTKQDAVSPQEAAVLDKYFSGGGDGGNSKAQGGGGHSKGASGWKIAAAGTALFLLLANQYIDAIFCKIPYCGNQLAALAIKAIIFFVVLFLMMRYM